VGFGSEFGREFVVFDGWMEYIDVQTCELLTSRVCDCGLKRNGLTCIVRTLAFSDVALRLGLAATLALKGRFSP
jgi:hypothetical protein